MEHHKRGILYGHYLTLPLPLLLRIASVLPNYQEKCESSSLSFHELLKDGVIMCEYVEYPILAVAPLLSCPQPF